jgi:hypothetical protein
MSMMIVVAGVMLRLSITFVGICAMPGKFSRVLSERANFLLHINVQRVKELDLEGDYLEYHCGVEKCFVDAVERNWSVLRGHIKSECAKPAKHQISPIFQVAQDEDYCDVQFRTNNAPHPEAASHCGVRR